MKNEEKAVADAMAFLFWMKGGREMNEKIDWRRKLTSRKFWLAVTSFVSLLIIALGHTESEAAQVSALIMAGAAVVAYVIGEGLADAGNANDNTEE